MFDLGSLINDYILWIVPIISIILTFLVMIIATPDNEHLCIKDFLSVGINLCISAITILITNYKSSTTSWLIIYFFIIILFISILTRKFTWKEQKIFKIISSIILFIIGIILCHIAIEHANGNIQYLIH